MYAALLAWCGLACSAEPVRKEFRVDGLAREAWLHVPPASSVKPPVVFGFHGHGGGARQAARSFRLHELWPEALVVYPQGLPTPGRLTDPEGKKTGWQHGAKDQGDRDLKFVDAILAELKAEGKADLKKVYATGHSNGGGFCYLLWEQRPQAFAAFAPSAAAALRMRGAKLEPRPVLHLAGRNDPLVRFAWQEQTMLTARQANGCAAAATPWAEGCLLYASDKNAPFISCLHDGEHKYPAAGPALIVKFFKERAAPPAAGSN